MESEHNDLKELIEDLMIEKAQMKREQQEIDDKVKRNQEKNERMFELVLQQVRSIKEQ